MSSEIKKIPEGEVEALDREKVDKIYEEISVEKSNFDFGKISEFSPVESRVLARKLRAENLDSVLVENVDKFPGLDHRELAKELINTAQASLLASHIDKFQGLDLKEIASKLIDQGQSMELAKNINKFEGLDQSEIAEELINKRSSISLCYYLEKFRDLKKDIAIALINTGKGKYVAEHPGSFKDLDHQDLARRSTRILLGFYSYIGSDRTSKLLPRC